MTKDVYAQILDILNMETDNKNKADLIKKIFDNCNDDMVKLIVEYAKGDI